MDTTPEAESTTKQPDRIAASKVVSLMEENREFLEATQQSADMAANNAEAAAHYAAKVADANYYVICLLALFGGGLAIAQLLAFLIIILLAVLHVIVL